MTKFQRVLQFSLSLLVFVLLACNEVPSSVPVTQRLVDQFDPQNLTGTPSVEKLNPIEWRFDGSSDRSWEAGVGVDELGIRDGRLLGQSTTDVPILQFERTSGLDDPDILHEIQVRLRVSGGTNLSINFFSGPDPDLATIAAGPWPISTPLLSGDEVRTYSLRSRFPVSSSELRQILVRPTDTAGVSFEVESLRLIFRREYLADIASGIGWHGLTNIYRESVVSRAPESIRWTLELPERPWLDLAVGTVGQQPVTFKVAVLAAGGEEETEILLQRTVTTPHRWEELGLSLEGHASRKVTIALSLHSKEVGSLGFWGSPSIRSKGAQPPVERDGSTTRPPQGVIVVLADTLRPDHLGVYGYERATAPAIRALAQEGALFQDTIAQGTWTKVSTASIFTSLYPTTHTVSELEDRVPSLATTLAEVYRAAGYATWGISSAPFTGKFSNLHQGYEVLHEADVSGKLPSKTAREYVDRTMAWIESHREVPFFVFLHVFDPHDPYEPYRPYDSSWADPSWHDEHRQQMQRVKKLITDPFLRGAGLPARSELLQAGLDPEVYRKRELDWYDGSIRAMDVEIGRLMERLRDLSLEDRTLVALISDHGEEFLEHGQMNHGQSVYGELVNVPMILKYPESIPPGLVVDETVQLIDLMPTLLELSGLQEPDLIQGRSLFPLLASSSQAGKWRPRPVFSEKVATSHPITPPPRELESQAIVFEGWKLIHNSQRPDGVPEFELYDHRKDPLDKVDVAADHPDVVSRLAKYLSSWREGVTADRLSADATGDVNQEELERLRALGYIQ